jgi:hypothetical protein
MQPNPMMPSQLYSCPPGTLPGGLTRTRFFDGMFLTQADLENEQVYWRMKRRLTNRALGSGVVWGLRLDFDKPTQTYMLGPGYALDCCGNDLVVECPLQITQSELFKRSQDYLLRAKAAAAQPSLGSAGNAEMIVINYTYASVVLQYVECPDAIRPVHRDACTPSGSSCEPSRIRESCRLLLVPPCANACGCDPTASFKNKLLNVLGKVGLKPLEKATTNATAASMPSMSCRAEKQTLGSLLLLFLHGYLAGADTNDVSPQSRLMASYALYNAAAWLWDVDLSSLGDEALTEVSNTINQAAQDLCHGLLYPGPRCRDDIHGVYLGEIAMTANGTVAGFSPWLCRREVLTGPLLNWWLCQFGFPPLDVKVNQIAWDNCETIKRNDVLSTAGQLKDLVESTVSEKQTVHPFDFLTTLARTATGVGAGSGLVKMEATAPNGLPITAVVPATAVASSDTSSHIAALVHAQLASASVPALSRSPLRDLVTELAARTPVSGVATGVDAATVKPLGAMTVSQLLATEPETVLAKIGGAKPTDAQRTAVNQLYLGAESFVRDATTATAGAAGKTGVTRAQLKSADLKAALKKVIGVKADALDAAIDAAAKK